MFIAVIYSSSPCNLTVTLLYSKVPWHHLKVGPVLSRDVPAQSTWTRLTIEPMISAAEHTLPSPRNKVKVVSVSSAAKCRQKRYHSPTFSDK